MKTRLTLGQALVATAMLGACGVVHAQWAWKDANGRPVYSDQPPPTSVPATRIFKAPRGQMPDVRPQPEPTASKAPPTLAERNAAYEQRRASAAEQAAKQADEAKATRARAASCESARSNQHALDGGARIARFNAQGEREFLTDAQRAEASKRNAALVAEHCR
ncbi:DUF4124 domain-containing protein [Pseudoduganella plicata]|uniref:DUF4124 domain-containing protein n=1 Tax=Pseudoduganella plicata TaxID=321984 RepID=A0A4P7BAD2_9BURK|nr:DUF4124 domain-containing protein [Pseudoduganella plicata]QBQ35536.1 DUF4124 domain-containing protein [Pseudoduganella plicata]GGY97066.1 hypothetical protein GCM10007388_33430 [Pseudoduganella plicata]